ncbi:MAG: hypothetical protein HPY85_14135 [Anaerolineae bacterium]|nr:hypothetical protein [Anaerolineae bacterium]
MKPVLALIRRWWWLFTCALLGTGFANLLLAFFPPVYISQSTILLTFDQHTSLEWNDKSMLALSNSIGRILLLPDTITAALAQGQNEGIAWTEKEFRQHSTVEQNFYHWVLTVRSTSPQAARTMLTAWTDTVRQTLETETRALAEVNTWQGQADLLITCFQMLPAETGHPQCSYGNASVIQKALWHVRERAAEAAPEHPFLDAADTAFALQILQPAQPAQRYIPAWHAWMILLAGAGGFVTGILTHQGSLPTLLFKKISPAGKGEQGA